VILTVAAGVGKTPAQGCWLGRCSAAQIIVKRNQTSFSFRGLRCQSVHDIKSLEGAEILWVEEAQNVSKKPWRTVITDDP
jgi:hypothetical protein